MSNNNQSAVNCIKTYIQEVGNQAENIISNGLNMSKKGNKYQCPNSSAHKHGDKNASMSWDNKKNVFYCFTCGKNINIYSYYKDYENKSFMDIIPKHIRDDKNDNNIKKIKNEVRRESKLMYEKGDLQELTKKDKEYLNNRGLADNTLKQFQVRSTKYTYQLDKKTNEYIKVKNEFPAFIYFDKKNINGIKYRPNWENCKYASYQNSNFSLYGKHLIDMSKKEVFIIEGEIDCMILKQNFPTKNIGSIPTGANSLETFFEKEKDFFDNFDNIIVIPDNDKAGKQMLIKFENYFGDKVSTIDFKRYQGEKDACDLFNKHGYEGLKSMLRTTISTNIFDISEIEIAPEDNYFLDTGFDSLDDALNGIQGGTVTTVAGHTGQGKTTFVEIFVNKVIGEGHKILTIDGEHRIRQKVNNVYLKVLSNFKDDKAKYIEEIKVHRKIKLFPNEVGQRVCKAWSKNKMFVYSVSEIPPHKRLNNEKMFEMIAKAVKYDGISMVVLDNLMSINNEMSKKVDNQYQQQEMFVQRCQALAKKYNVAVVLVAHMKKPSSTEKITEYSIFGSSTISNYMDNIIYVRRANGEDHEKYKTTLVNGVIQILKNREESELKEVLLTFDNKTKTLFEIDIKDVYKPKVKLIDFGLKKYLDDEVLKQKEEEPEQTLFSQLGLGGDLI